MSGASAPERCISVIIPVLNEAARLPGLLAALAADRQGAAREVLVVDGGSSDGTPESARANGADQVLSTAAGRGRQLRAGAAVARGDILLFLHADTGLPAGALAAIRQGMDGRLSCPGGNFRLIFAGETRFARWITWLYPWFRRRGFYYGDSGIFVRRSVYDHLGGMLPIALMEDYAFVCALEAAGETLCIDEPPLVTSCRRFRGRCPAAIVGGWVLLHALYHLGVSPDRLARLYDSKRERTGR